MEDIRRCSGCMDVMSEGNFCPHCGYDNGSLPENPIFIRPGTKIGNYLFGKVLGHGGFGITYLGYDILNNRKVAIKEYLPSELATRRSESSEVSIFTGDKQQSFRTGIEKFKKEAELLKTFSDFPGIVDAYDLFEANNTAYFVMEYIEGITLKEYVAQKGGRLPFETVRTILMPVIDALAEMHKKDILHRDISPDNIYITGTKQVKLLDFGAARQTDQNKGLSVILKHGFTPKEQYFTKGNQGPWTDVYALGATAYYMMTGTVPQPALDRLEQDKLVPLTTFVQVSPQVDAIIRKALAVEEYHRYQSVNDFKMALLNPENEAPVVQPSVQPVQQSTIPVTPDVQPTVQQPVQSMPQQMAASTAPVYQTQNSVATPNTPASPSANDKPKKKKGLKVALIVIPLILLLLIGGGAATYILMPEVPKITGEDLDTALKKLKKAGFTVDEDNIEYEIHKKAPYGEVIKQEPAAGKKTFNKKVVLVVSKGPKEVSVPDVIDKEKDEAIEILKKAGLEAKTEEVYSSKDVGIVVDMDTEAGEIVDNGTKITIFVSKGKDPNGITFADENFKRAVYYELGLSDSDQLTLDMAKEVTDLYLGYENIENIDGIEVFTSLKYLDLAGNELEEIPTLPSTLLYLDLAYNYLDKVDVSYLTKLESLYLDYNELTEFPSVPVSLDTLYIGGNFIKDISPVSNLKNLLYLDISYNNITDFSPLDAIADNLYSLYTEGNPGTYKKGGSISSDWVNTLTSTNQVNNYIKTTYPSDHETYVDLSTYTSADLKLESAIIYDGTVKMGNESFDFYYIESEGLIIDFYQDINTGVCCFYDVYGASLPFLGDYDIICGASTYIDVIDLLGNPSAVYMSDDYVFLCYETSDIVYGFAALKENGTIDGLRVMTLDFYK